MTPLLLTWLLSITGAALFFAAGRLFAIARRHDVQVAIPAQPVLRAKDLATLSDGDVSGDVLRAILARESDSKDLTGAVIADEMGLVVVATGELSDALAAYGALLAGIGTKARDALPLEEVRQVVMYGEHDATLTVRKLATSEERFSLVTLSPPKQTTPPQTAAGLGR